MRVLVTGAAGFIGFHVSQTLLERGEMVVGLDNLNAYYDPTLKRARLNLLDRYDRFTFCKQDLSEGDALMALFERFGFTHVINLAAQAGVRYSLEAPQAYISSNLIGFSHLLEACRLHPVEHLVYASSGSVSGLNQMLPSSVAHTTGHPMSLYAATKRSNELCAHAYSHLFGIPTTGLRFFSVYGPWGRPDMALFLFTEKMLAGETIDVYNFGEMTRDWTHVSDITAGVIQALDTPATPDLEWNGETPILETSSAPFRLYHLGRGEPASLMGAIELLEEALGVKATKRLLPMQPGDVKDTFAEIEAAQRALGFDPKVDLAEGITSFVEWYRKHNSTGDET
jgi:UDP-glucuronate 4-epimerase